MLLAAIVVILITNCLGFRQVHPTMGTGHHLGYGRFVRRWLSARCQGAFDDSQDQPQADQDDDEAEKLAHGFRKVLIYGFFCKRSRE